MKSLLIKAPRQLELADVPEPSPAAGQVKLRVHHCAICGSDTQEYLEGDTNGVFGHEFSGVITEVGAGVTRCKVGQRIAAHAYRSRGFSEYAVIDAHKAVPLRQGIAMTQGALLETMVVLLTALRHCAYRVGDTCFVSGCGSIGLMGILILRACGARRIVAANRGDYRRAKAREFGADYAFNPADEPVEAVLNRFSEKFDFALECIGNGPSFLACKRALKSGGILCGLGVSNQPIGVSTMQMFTFDEEFSPGIQVRGMTPFDTSMFETAQRMILDKLVDPERIVTSRRPFAQVIEAFGNAVAPGREHIKTVINMVLDA